MLTCAWCAAVADVPEGSPAPPTWSSSVERGVTRYYCERCTRENLRSIEGKLDSEWW